MSTLKIFAAALALALSLIFVPHSTAFNAVERAHILPVSGTLWINNRTTNNVLAVDPATGALLAVIPVGARPIGITIPPGTGKIYVANETGNSVSVISKATRTVSATITTGARPHHISHSPDGRFVYVAEFGTNKIGVIETATDRRVTEYSAGAQNALTHAAAISRDGRTLYAVNTVTNSLAALDAQTGALRWSLDVGNDPNEFVTSPDDRTGYISLRAENKVKVINLETRTVTREITTGTQPETLVLSPDGKLLIVALRENPAKVSVIDLANNFTVTSVALNGTVAAHNTISPDGRFSFVAYEGTTAGVAVIDHTTQTLVANYLYPGSGQPHGIFYEAAAASVSAASYSPVRLAAESIATAFHTPFVGLGFATATQSAAAQPLPTTLAGTRVLVRDSAGMERAAPLLFVSPLQINYVIPAGTAAGTALVTVTSSLGVASTGLAEVAPVAPGLFAANASGRGLAAAVILRIRADGSQQFEPVARYDEGLKDFVAIPIDLGAATDQVFLVLYGTGVRGRGTLSAASVRVGGEEALVSFAGAAPDLTGVDQINARLPRHLAGRGEVEVRLVVDGQTANAVSVRIK